MTNEEIFQTLNSYRKDGLKTIAVKFIDAGNETMVKTIEADEKDRWSNKLATLNKRSWSSKKLSVLLHLYRESKCA